MIVVLSNDPDGFGKGDMLVIAYNVIAANDWRTGSDLSDPYLIAGECVIGENGAKL